MRGAKMPAFPEGGTPIRRPRAVPREGIRASAALLDTAQS